MSIPAELSRREKRLQTIELAKREIEQRATEQITPYIAVHREKHNLPLEERFAPPGPLPEEVEALTRKKHRLKTPEGKEIYAKRKSTVEPVFGIIKAIMGFRQFFLRGLTAVSGEWNLVCMAYNFKRMHVLAH
jgi:hypothetical protein